MRAEKGAWESLWFGVRVRETAAPGMIQKRKKTAREKLAINKITSSEFCDSKGTSLKNKRYFGGLKKYAIILSAIL